MPSKEKIRFVVTLDKEDKEKLETIAENDTRSLNNLINKILKDYIKAAENDKK